MCIGVHSFTPIYIYNVGVGIVIGIGTGIGMDIDKTIDGAFFKDNYVAKHSFQTL